MPSKQSQFMILRSVLFLFLGIVLGASYAQAQQLQETSLKARYLVGFTSFVTWEEPNSKEAPYTIGVLGNGEFLKAATEQVASMREAGRKVGLIALEPEDSLERIDILFIPEEFTGDVDRILRQAQTMRLLTVGESPGFAESGGVIGFVVKKNRLRFEINREAAESSGIRLSSKLLRLAE